MPSTAMGIYVTMPLRCQADRDLLTALGRFFSRGKLIRSKERPDISMAVTLYHDMSKPFLIWD